jgi:hypothetical protein
MNQNFDEETTNLIKAYFDKTGFSYLVINLLQRIYYIVSTN